MPKDHEEDGVQLGFWLTNRRQQYRKGKLDESYQQRLEKIGVIWDPLGDQWECNFALLQQFKEREGHCNVPQWYEVGEIQLGNWVSTQRQFFKKGKLDESYQRRLDKLGMSWDPLVEQWERNFALLE